MNNYEWMAYLPANDPMKLDLIARAERLEALCRQSQELGEQILKMLKRSESESA